MPGAGTILAERAARRERDPRRVSDAAVALGELESWDGSTRCPPSAHLVVRTDRSSDQVLGDVLALLDQRRLDVT